jgi:hypothetical protein
MREPQVAPRYRKKYVKRNKSPVFVAELPYTGTVQVDLTVEEMKMKAKHTRRNEQNSKIQ